MFAKPCHSDGSHRFSGRNAHLEGEGRGVNPPFAERKGVRGMPYYVILNVAKRSEESKPERWRFLAPLGMTWGFKL